MHEIDPDLRIIIESWPSLSTSVRGAILAMIASLTNSDSIDRQV
jgi:hypothetical protein